jgi:hypothetical protein
MREERTLENFRESWGTAGTGNVVYARHDLFMGSPAVMRRDNTGITSTTCEAYFSK